MNRRRCVAPRALRCAVLAACALAGCAHEPSASEAPAPRVPLAVARAGYIVERIDAQGRVGSLSGGSTKLAFPESGILKSIDVRVGSAVRAGEPVAELDRAALAAPLAQARADARSAAAGYAGGSVADAAERSAAAKLAVAVAKLATLQRGGAAALSGRIEAEATARQAALKVTSDRVAVARENKLFAAGVAARKDLDAADLQLANDVADERGASAKVSLAASDLEAALTQARADVAAARSELAAARPQRAVLAQEVASARAKLDAASVAYDNGVVTAPAAGVILAVFKQPGEAVDPATPVVEMGPAAGNTVTLTVAADAARRIVAGDAVTLHLPSVAGRLARGRILAVVPAVDAAAQVVTVLASGAPPGAVPGDAIAATVEVGRARGTIVPASAVVEDPETGKTVVFVRRPEARRGEPAFEMRAVEMRSSDAARAAIGTGLRPGEVVAAQGGYALLAPSGG